jgi:sugar fermentation stimulation protein A
LIAFPSPLERGALLRRYKRFFADIRLDGGGEITAHCPNSGAMLGVADQGMPVWVSASDNPARALAYTWELVEQDGVLVGINTAMPNRLVYQALVQHRIPELGVYDDIRREVTVGGSRLDFRVTGADGRLCFIEVKNCHLRRDGFLEFPDCVTSRGAKHLHELATIAQGGGRAVMLYLGQRGDCRAFRVADDLDPAYAAGFNDARSAGVEMLCYSAALTTHSLALGNALVVP